MTTLFKCLHANTPDNRYLQKSAHGDLYPRCKICKLADTERHRKRAKVISQQIADRKQAAIDAEQASRELGGILRGWV